MRHYRYQPLALAVAAFALTAMGPSLHAQDRPNDHRDDHAASQNRPDDHRDDQVDKYRHAHPHSAARCHDGFFTKTTDRNRACSKHGGIDVWLAP